MFTRAWYTVTLEEKARSHGDDGVEGIREEGRWQRVWVFNHYFSREERVDLTLVMARRKGWLGRGLPGTWEWRTRTFTQEEAEGMRFGHEEERGEWEPSIRKPLAVRWGEVYGELRRVRSRIE